VIARCEHTPRTETTIMSEEEGVMAAELEIQRLAAAAKSVEVQLEAEVATARNRLAHHRATAMPEVVCGNAVGRVPNPVHEGFVVDRGLTPGHPPDLISDTSVRCAKHGGVLVACTGKGQGAANKCDNSRWGEALLRCAGPCFCVPCHDWPPDKR
jgi:hypothetical protein